MDIIKTKKAIRIYLFMTVGVSLFLGVLSGIFGDAVHQVLRAVMWLLPLIAMMTARMAAEDDSPILFRLNVFRKRNVLIFAAFIPALAVILGALVYYLFFPEYLLPNVQGLFDFAASFGLPGLEASPSMAVFAAFALLIVSALALPIHMLKLAEEVGWRGYLLPKMTTLYGAQRAVLLSGVLWGLSYAPLVWFGFNYGDGYFGAPYTGIAAMIVFCVVVGIILSYVTHTTNNCAFAAVASGSISVSADLMVASGVYGDALLGPAATGFIGMSVLAALAVCLFGLFKKKRRLDMRRK